MGWSHKMERRSVWPRIEAWNRRLHYYSGLVLLPFLLLFTLSGLLLNHSTWRFSNFWPTRVETAYERPFQPLNGANDLEKVRDLMRQLNLSGEIEWPASRQQGRFDFRVERPGRNIDLHADLERQIASVKQVDVNGWGVIRSLHEFTGVRATNQAATRDWRLTILWSATMDILAFGAIFMTLNSLWMWWRVKRDRRLGLAVLALGSGICVVLAVGVRLFQP